jgi:hypothetical protein
VHLSLAFRLLGFLENFDPFQDSEIAPPLCSRFKRHEKASNCDRVLDEAPSGAALFVDAIDEPAANVQTLVAQQARAFAREAVNRRGDPLCSSRLATCTSGRSTYRFSHKASNARETFCSLPPSSIASCAEDAKRNRARLPRSARSRAMIRAAFVTATLN